MQSHNDIHELKSKPKENIAHTFLEETGLKIYSLIDKVASKAFNQPIFALKNKANKLHDCAIYLLKIYYLVLEKKIIKIELSRQQIRTIICYECHNELSATECHRKLFRHR